MTNTGRPPQAEELAALHEQLAESRAEVERLQSDTADAEARAATAAAETAEVRTELLSIQQFRTAAEAEEQSARTYLEAAEARLRSAAEYAHTAGLQVNAGHGINYLNIRLVRTIPHLAELNIGHSIVSRAVLVGLETATAEMLAAMGAAD